ncbi:MAG: alpha/beta fold hydrolase [Arenicellales bacterium]|jgi:pimeloyl-ACP methyl ester carboxylesterase|nr:alpha/beta fold hydrolase [Arenicellales bacterium]MDP7119824.1 alpha/beta fold hydrolase [Arenicellales bacterium]MDP7192160.1 alpha/beta fold hydrolase [Arenicellales bacterium]
MPTATGKETVILIHGLSDTREVWARQVAALTSFNVVAYDVRGFGASPVGAGDGTVEQMADDVAQIMSALETGPAWLVGFSMGGVIAQRFALDFPALARGLVLIASSCTVGRAGLEFFDKRIGEVTNGGLEALATLSAGDARGCIVSEDADLLAEYHRIRSGSVSDPDGYLNACRAMRSLADGSLAENLGEISCPTLVIAAEFDPYCPPRASQLIADAIPGATIHVIEGAGHCVHMEADRSINDLVHRFIEKHA